MTTTEAITANRAPDGIGQVSARLITRPLLVRFVSVVGTATSFYLLLSRRPAVRQVGRYGDQRTTALLAPGVLTAAAGVLALSLAAIPAAVIAGAGVFGLGFGVTQNATQTLMFNRVAESGYGAVSAMWNLAYDGGMGLGAAGFGVLVVYTGYPVAFVLIAALLLTVLLSTALLPMVLLSAALAAARRRRGRRLPAPEHAPRTVRDNAFDFRRIGRSRSCQLLRQRARDPGFRRLGRRVAPRPSPTAWTPAAERRKRLAITGTGHPLGVRRPCNGYRGHRSTRHPVPAEDWNELTSSSALKDRDSSRDLWSPPIPAGSRFTGPGSRKPPRAATACRPGSWPRFRTRWCRCPPGSCGQL